MNQFAAATAESRPPGFLAQVRSFPGSFWIANTMEIFERMAWYGFFAVSSLYITGPVETGGLGFTSEQRGAIQAIIPFLLYLMPVLTGALADRYGYKRMFIIAYVGMAVFYYALGQFKTMPTFLMAFFCVAVAAAIFKPVVVGTVARLTNESNSRMGFGIFYMMVNVGGFVGPIVAGVVRGASWEHVFMASSVWAVVNLIICILFYREPPRPADWRPRTLAQVWQTVYEVLGNLRFFLAVMVVVVAMMIAQFGPWWFQWWPHAAVFIAAWIALNFVWDALLPDPETPSARVQAPARRWAAQRMHCSDWRFALYLLILSGFWTAFNQIFLTMPEYIRDFSETRPLVEASRMFGDRVARAMASVDENELYSEIDAQLRAATGAGVLVVEESAPTSEAEVVARNRKRIDELAHSARKLAGMPYLPSGVREEAEKATDALRDVNRGDADAVNAALQQFDDRLRELGRLGAIETYKTYPGITPEVIAKLEVLGRRIGESAGSEHAKPLTPLDLLESCRTVLGYKVRFAPVEYAEVLASISPSPRTPSDDALTEAMKALNKRLREFRQVEFADAGAARVRDALRGLLEKYGLLITAETLEQTAQELSSDYRKVSPEALATGWRRAAYHDPLKNAISRARQFNPEFIVNLNALGIVLFQVLVSFAIARFHQFTGMIAGMIVAGLGIGLSALASDHGMFGVGGVGIIVCAGILTFSFGEMMASPTSQEYVGRIAPEDKKALYMGYYFVAVALGNLFGGILSGQLYGSLARDMQRPDLMWIVFGVLMFLTALIFLIYNRYALPHGSNHALAPAT